MKGYFLPSVLLLVAYLICFSFIARTYGELPARVASHFDALGQANGWMSRDGMVEFSVAFAVVLPALLIGQMALTGRIPARFVNIPHRDFWLAPERRRETTATMVRFGIWLAALAVMFITGMHWLLVQANLGGTAKLDGSNLGFVAFAFLCGVLAWVMALRKHFSLPK